jgi:pyrroloquinoline quinone biosynthesis protein A
MSPIPWPYHENHEVQFITCSVCFMFTKAIVPSMHLECRSINQVRRNTMWTTPAATEMRFGFEVTMYVMNK